MATRHRIVTPPPTEEHRARRKTSHLTAIVDAVELAALRRRAKALGLTLATVIRAAVHQLLDRHPAAAGERESGGRKRRRTPRTGTGG